MDGHHFHGVTKSTKNVTVIFTEERVHLLLPENANLVIFQPTIALFNKNSIVHTKCAVFIVAMNHEIELQVAYTALQQICLPKTEFMRSKRKNKTLVLPPSVLSMMPVIQSIESVSTSFERNMEPLHYYDHKSNYSNNLREFMYNVRNAVYGEFIRASSKDNHLKKGCDRVCDAREHRDLVTNANTSLLDPKIAKFKHLISKAKENNEKSSTAAVHRFRLREHVQSHRPVTSHPVIDKAEDEYSLAIREMIDSLSLQVKEIEEAMLPSETVSIYSIQNPEYRYTMDVYNNQTPPPIPLIHSSNARGLKNPSKKKKKQQLDSQPIVRMECYIPCDPCKRLFRIHQEYSIHIKEASHRIHQQLADEETKFMEPLPFFDNQSRGYFTTCQTTLDISELWKTSQRTYRCSLCAVDASSAGLLLKHYKSRVHITRLGNGKTMIRECSQCGFTSTTKPVNKELHEKSEQHQKETTHFFCCLCLTSCYGHREYACHMEKCIVDARKKECPLLFFVKKDELCATTCYICKKSFSKYGHFKNHLDSELHKETREKFSQNAQKCQTCKKMFFHPVTFNDHLKESEECLG